MLMGAGVNFHRTHMLVLNAVKDLTRPSRKAVLYMLMGAGVNFHRKDTPYAVERSWTAMTLAKSFRSGPVVGAMTRKSNERVV